MCGMSRMDVEIHIYVDVHTRAYYCKHLMIDEEKYDMRRDLILFFLADALYATYLYHTDRNPG